MSDRSRVIFTVIILCLYVVLFNFYIWQLTHIGNGSQTKLLYNYITFFTLIFYFINQYDTTQANEQLNKMIFFVILSNFILIILTHHRILTQAPPMFLSFNGLIFAVTSIIGITGYNHGYFKK